MYDNVHKLKNLAQHILIFCFPVQIFKTFIYTRILGSRCCTYPCCHRSASIDRQGQPVRELDLQDPGAKFAVRSGSTSASRSAVAQATCSGRSAAEFRQSASSSSTARTQQQQPLRSSCRGCLRDQQDCHLRCQEWAELRVHPYVAR